MDSKEKTPLQVAMEAYFAEMDKLPQDEIKVVNINPSKLTDEDLLTHILQKAWFASKIRIIQKK